MSISDSKKAGTLALDHAAAAEDFEWAVDSGDTQLVRQYLDSNKIPNWLNPARCSVLLQRAVANRDATMVALLLKLQPYINLETKSSEMSPLWMAVICPHVEIIKLLVRAGANVHRHFGPNVLHDPESTMLHYLAMSSFPVGEELIDILIQHGAEVNAQDSRGQTPLHYAVGMSEKKITTKLISKGANVNVADKFGETPLLTACKIFANEEIVKLLVRNGADVFAKTHKGLNALHFLANCMPESECPAAAELLLKRGVPLHELDDDKQYAPLHYAVIGGREEMTKLFLEYKADANACGGAQEFPLSLAAKCNSSLIIEMLLIKEADIKKTMKNDKTALHIACKNLKDKNISVLLEYGANINALDHEGATPFSLIEFKNLSLSTQAMIRMFAKLTALNKPPNESDLGIIKQYPKLQMFYKDCLKEIDEMKKLKLFNDISYFSMFSKSLAKLAIQLRDCRFGFPLKITKEIEKLFPIYCADVSLKLCKAECLCVNLYKIEDGLNFVFSDTSHLIIREIMLASLPYHAHV